MEKATSSRRQTTRTSTKSLCTLSEWSRVHIKSVFEAKTDENCLEAIDSTFSQDIAVTFNGQPIRRDDIRKMVLSMRHTACANGLSVHWEQAVELADDPRTNRGGRFDGFYILRGLSRRAPDSGEVEEYERYKNVSVTIASESSDPNADTRRIVRLDYIASDVRI